MANYTCLTCNKAFEGHDPLDFTEIDIKQMVLPRCPWSEGGLSYDKFMSLDVDSKEFVQGAEARKKAQATHRVVQGNSVIASLPPKGKWAAPLKITPGAPPKKTLTPEEAQQKVEAQRREMLEIRTKELVNQINNCIRNGLCMQPTSAKYGFDTLYGSDTKLVATSDVIHRAAELWELGGGDYWSTSEFKNERKDRLRNETNFMKSKNPVKGRHNVHVIHVDSASKIIAAPLFETTIQRKIRLGHSINSDWYSPGDKISGQVPYAPGKV